MIRTDLRHNGDWGLALEGIAEAYAHVERRLRAAVELEERILLLLLLQDVDTLRGRVRFVRTRLDALEQRRALQLIVDD